MKYLLLLLTSLIPDLVYAECEWTESEAIRNLKTVEVAYGKNFNALLINNKIKLNVNFDIIRPSNNCPECNFVWAKQSSQKDIIYVYVENDKYQRNGWIINLKSFETIYFVDNSVPQGRHYKAEFVDASTLKITHAGMGYKDEQFYVLRDNLWQKK